MRQSNLWLFLLLFIASVPSRVEAQGDVHDDTAWQWDCRLMRPVGPNIERMGRLQLQFNRSGGETFIQIVSEDFPEFEADRQLLVNGSVDDTVSPGTSKSEQTAWIVQTMSGRKGIETISHGSRNGGGTGILISTYEMTTIGSLPEDFFQYHAVGICS